MPSEKDMQIFRDIDPDLILLIPLPTQICFIEPWVILKLLDSYIIDAGSQSGTGPHDLIRSRKKLNLFKLVVNIIIIMLSYLLHQISLSLCYEYGSCLKD